MYVLSFFTISSRQDEVAREVDSAFLQCRHKLVESGGDDRHVQVFRADIVLFDGGIDSATGPCFQ